MALINRFKRELFLKIIYVGPAKSGKSENLRQIHQSMDDRKEGGFLIHRDPDATSEPATLFFDFLPLSLGQVGDFSVRLHLFSLPGSGKYDAITRLLLRGVDGIVCVLPSIAQRMQENLDALASIQELLRSFGRTWGQVPLVFQYSFQDSPRALPMETMRELFNPGGFPDFAAQAHRGVGVLETLRGITHETVMHFKAGVLQAPEPGP